MKVKTDYKDCPYITAGKEYEVLNVSRNGCFLIDLDYDNLIMAKKEGEKCAHLDGIGTWEIIE